jgi:hypothetical protein
MAQCFRIFSDHGEVPSYSISSKGACSLIMHIKCYAEFRSLISARIYQWLASEGLRGLHLSCAMCPFRAVVRVNSAPHLGQ